MEKSQDDIIVAIIITSVLVVVLSVFTLLFFLVLVRKRQVLKREKEHLRDNYEKALLETKLEIQEQTLNNISREIHDNIGQVLSFVKLSLSTVSGLPAGDKERSVNEAIHLIGETINDLRDLSRSLSLDKIRDNGFFKMISDEADRLNRAGIIKTYLDISGKPYSLGDQKDLIIFRIIQEIINNTLKHSGSENLKISLIYRDNLFTLTVQDSGIGMDTETLKYAQGQGLSNIRYRAELIGANVVFKSKLNEGCITELTLNVTNDNILTE
ncbi:sensor histidine kinase [Arcticibacter tournemirensis]|uniref:histidine kinase n=1 Tax=Arcticibacter tournemirensis TaxID=699437 RepID=A0A4Q0MH43_9SPHI|nr:ATP-binding protein [Arcticibacter tournemirensis]RXF72296.1 hypothetical protein EKH83_00790 [Arcticibacter tournemirensis]